MSGDPKCPACVIRVIDPGGPGEWRDPSCTGRPGCVRADHIADAGKMGEPHPDRETPAPNSAPAEAGVPDGKADHPRIARALALIDRVGDAAAEAILTGEAAVVPVVALRLMTGVAEQAVENAKVAGGMMVDDATLADLARDALAAMLAAGRLDREGGR
jgi:hypothetical protein